MTDAAQIVGRAPLPQIAPWFFEPLPRRHYPVVLVDPPWKHSGGTKGRPQHYQRMTLAEVMALPIRQLLHPDGARVFLWITAPLLNRLGEIQKAWRLRYSSVIPWVKLWPKDAKELFLFRDSFARGTGLEVVGNVEFLVILKVGRPQSIRPKLFHSPLVAGRREHSRKPDSIHPDIEERLRGPYCELFARQSREGWDTWGNQRTKFDAPAPTIVTSAPAEISPIIMPLPGPLLQRMTA